jgi:predicted peptidase
MAKELAALGTKTRYTEYPFVGHDAWDPAFNSPDLWDWLLEQHQPRPSVAGN